MAVVGLSGSFALLTVFARYLNTGFTIEQQVYLRAGVAFVMGGVVFGARIRWGVVVRARGREWGVIAVRAVLLYGAGATLYSRAATLTDIGDVSFISSLPLVAVLGLVLGRVAATARRVGYVAGSAAGVAVLSLHGGWNWDRGDLLALVAMVAIALSYLGRSWQHGELNNHEITVLTLGVGALCVAAGSLALGQGAPDVARSGALWGAVAVAGALNCLNVYLINYGFERLDAARAGNLLTLECVWGLAFGLLFYGQRPSVAELAGGAVIIGCAVGLNAEESRKTTKSHHEETAR